MITIIIVIFIAIYYYHFHRIARKYHIKSTPTVTMGATTILVKLLRVSIAINSSVAVKLLRK